MATTPELSEAAQRFIASMTMTFDMWHDGMGYDLDALKGLSQTDLDAIESILIGHSPPDWRDVEALAMIDSPRAREAVKQALTSSDAAVRRVARKYAPQEEQKSDDRERLLVKSLREDELFGGLGQSIDDAADFHPPRVVEALFDGALKRDGEVACNLAALLFYIHGKASEPFDWAQRPFFLRFNTEDRAERETVFLEMCEKLGVDASKYLQ